MTTTTTPYSADVATCPHPGLSITPDKCLDCGYEPFYGAMSVMLEDDDRIICRAEVHTAHKSTDGGPNCHGLSQAELEYSQRHFLGPFDPEVGFYEPNY